MGVGGRWLFFPRVDVWYTKHVYVSADHFKALIHRLRNIAAAAAAAVIDIFDEGTILSWLYQLETYFCVFPAFGICF